MFASTASRPDSHSYPCSKLLWCSIAAALFIAVSGFQPSFAQSDNTVRVTIQRATTALPLVVGDKKGFFTKNNVVVKWSISQVQISESIATLGRQFDVTMGTQPALIAAVGQGVPIAVITGGGLDTKKVQTSDIVASKSSGITNIRQLQGKTVGTLTLTGNIHYALLNVLRKEGVDFKTIRWVSGTVPQLPDLLKAGRMEAIEEIEPFATSAVAAGGVSLGDPFRSVGDRAYIGIWLSQRQWANNHKDLVLRFNKALSEAATWIEANHDESKQILSSYTGLKGPVLDRVPIPEFHFSTTASDLAKEEGQDLGTWIDILKHTSDFPAVKLNDMIPSWAK